MSHAQAANYDPVSKREQTSDAPQGIVSAAHWREAVTAKIPSLRAFAWSLSRNASDADDLVQETLTKAWNHRDRFQPGTNLRAWLFTILRNSWYSSVSRRKREVADADGKHAARLTIEGSQEWSLAVHELRLAMDELPPTHREAIVLVGAAGLSYEEAAHVAGCALGTIKSRVNRARNQLAELMDVPRGDTARTYNPAIAASSSSTVSSRVAQEQTNRTEPSSNR